MLSRTTKYSFHGLEQTLQSDLEGDGDRDADCAGDLLFFTGDRDLREHFQSGQYHEEWRSHKSIAG